jgi:hypothetical protein
LGQHGPTAGPMMSDRRPGARGARARAGLIIAP